MSSSTPPTSPPTTNLAPPVGAQATHKPLMIVMGLALEDPCEGDGSGPPKQKVPGTMNRYFEAANYARQFRHSHDIRVYVSAGYGPINPTEQNAGRKVSIAEQTKRVAIEMSLPLADKIEILPLCWSTELEIYTAMKKAREVADSLGVTDVTFVIATNRAHSFRVAFNCKKHKRSGWKVVVRRAKHHFSLRSTLREVPALLRDMIKPRPLPKLP